MGAGEIHELVEHAFNAGDADALLTLYEADAQMIRDDGTTASGVGEIRDVWAGFISLGGTIKLQTRYVIEAGDIALLSNTWTFEGQDMSFSSTTAEVARRASDGSWRYVIDNPFAAPADTP